MLFALDAYVMVNIRHTFHALLERENIRHVLHVLFQKKNFEFRYLIFFLHTSPVVPLSQVGLQRGTHSSKMKCIYKASDLLSLSQFVLHGKTYRMDIKRKEVGKKMKKYECLSLSFSLSLSLTSHLRCVDLSFYCDLTRVTEGPDFFLGILGKKD